MDQDMTEMFSQNEVVILPSNVSQKTIHVGINIGLNSGGEITSVRQVILNGTTQTLPTVLVSSSCPTCHDAVYVNVSVSNEFINVQKVEEPILQNFVEVKIEPELKSLDIITELTNVKDNVEDQMKHEPAEDTNEKDEISDTNEKDEVPEVDEDQPEFECDQCGFQTTRRKYLYRHKLRHKVRKENIEKRLQENTTSDFKCDVCGFGTTTQKYLQRHKRKHVNDTDKPFHCRACGKSFINKFACDRHEQTHKNPDTLYNCETCNKSFMHPTYLKIHIRKHHKEASKEVLEKIKQEEKRLLETIDEPFMIEPENIPNILKRKKVGVAKCNDCGQRFYGEASLIDHNQRSKMNVTCFQCKDKETTFHCREAFFKHTKEEHKGVFQCNFCFKILESSAGWSIHMKTKHKLYGSKDGDVIGECNRCHRKFSTKAEYDEHFKELLSEDFPCWMCDNDNKMYHTKTEIYKHIQDMHDSNHIPCPKCEPNTNSFQIKGFWCHIKSHYVENPFKCSYCEQQFKLKDERDTHQIICKYRNPAPNFTCETCGKQYSNANHLRRHVRIIHSEHRNIKLCQICGQTFSKEFLYQEHLVIHEVNNPRPYSCDKCNKKFKTYNSVRLHILCIHYPRDIGDYKCDRCGDRFQDQQCLARHKMSHYERVPVQCSICNRMLSDRRQLPTHMRIVHTTEGNSKKFNCDKCDFATSSKDYLKAHKRQHLSDAEKPYQCKYCGKGFINRNLGVRHEMIHSDTRPHGCETCGKTFRHAAGLKDHMRLHTGEKPYECQVCQKKFSDRGCFRSHLIAHEKQLNITLDKSVKKQNLIIGKNV